MQTTRTRVVTPRKQRLWVSSFIQLSLTAAGVAGQAVSSIMLANFLSISGRTVKKGDTISRLYVAADVVQTLASANTVFANNITFGIGWAPELTDAADFPDLEFGLGDWQLHKELSFVEPGAAAPVLGPGSGGHYEFESKAQRSAPGTAFAPFMVAQARLAPSIGVYTVNLKVRALWLINA